MNALLESILYLLKARKRDLMVEQSTYPQKKPYERELTYLSTLINKCTHLKATLEFARIVVIVALICLVIVLSLSSLL